MDKEVLGSVSGLSLELFDNKLPQYHKEMEIRFSSKKELFLAYEIKNLFQKGIIKESQHEGREFKTWGFLWNDFKPKKFEWKNAIYSF